MERYFYYRRDDEWVRVSADSFTQESPPAARGECPTLYDWSFDCQGEHIPPSFTGQPPNYYFGSYSTRISGPLSQYQIELPGPFVGGMLNFQSPPINFSIGGVVVGSFAAVDNTNTDKRRGSNQAIGPINNVSIIRVDGQPDNCGSNGGACQTRFFLAGVQVLGLDSCPEILDSADEGQCSDCCRELLPIARSISI